MELCIKSIMTAKIISQFFKLMSSLVFMCYFSKYSVIFIILNNMSNKV